MSYRPGTLRSTAQRTTGYSCRISYNRCDHSHVTSVFWAYCSVCFVQNANPFFTQLSTCWTQDNIVIHRTNTNRKSHLQPLSPSHTHTITALCVRSDCVATVCTVNTLWILHVTIAITVLDCFAVIVAIYTYNYRQLQ